MSKNNENKEDEDNLKINKKDNKIWKTILYGLIVVIIVFIWLSYSASITFLIKDATQDILNKVLPSNCKEYPYGSKEVFACKDHSDIFKKVIRDLCVMAGLITRDEGIEIDIEKGIPTVTGVPLKSNESKKGGKKSDTKESEGVNKRGTPYKWYTNNPTNDFREYVNWLLSSLITTKVEINSYTKAFLKFIKRQELDSSILVIFSFTIMSLFSFLISIYSFFSLFSSQVLSITSHGLITGILIFLSFWAMFFIDMGISSFYSIKLMYDICIKPLLNSNWRLYIKNILLENQTIIGYIFGFTFIQILNSIKMNKNYESPVKLIPTIIFYSIVIVHFIRWLWKRL